ncbi:MAG: 4-hydroxybenzoate octaprenyltransferase [Acetobacteraceae bacterium]|nr:4-hydroxybenzoate octaprenyltransferase [Acetobacteraceae bacterium]
MVWWHGTAYSAGVTSWTDIPASGWVARLPPKARAFAVLARLDRPIGAWLLFLPGLWSILLARLPATATVWLLLLFGVGAVVMRGAGCVVNDMWDRDMDRRVTRTASRPLASGALRMREAALFLAVLLAIGLAILLQLDPLAQCLGVASLLLVALYPLAKRVTWWPQAVLGITFSWAAPMGYAGATGRLDGAAAALYAAAFFWILGYDTIYAHQDREDDALIGVHSTARLFARSTKPFLAVCYTLTIGLLAVAGALAGLRFTFAVALLLPTALLVWQAWSLDVDDPAGCLARFKLNRETGLLIGLAILLGTISA